MTVSPLILPWLAVGTPLGACVGSFLGTAARRAAAGEEFLSGRSRCDACGVSLSYAATIPLASFLIRRGRCEHCNGAIALTHPGAELAGALVVGLSVLFAPPSLWGPLIAVGWLLVFLAVYDLATLRLPDAGSGMIAAGGLLIAAWRGDLEPQLLVGTVVLVVLLGVTRAFAAARGRVGLGGGDVKLLAALATWTGATLTPVALVLAASAALVWMATQGTLRTQARLAFGPFIAAAFWPVILGRLAA